MDNEITSQLVCSKCANAFQVPPRNPFYEPLPRYYPIFLSNGVRALVQVPGRMAEADLGLLKTQVDQILANIEATIEMTTENRA